MGWFIISAVAGLITYWGARLVYSQLADATGDFLKKTFKWSKRVLPWVFLLAGLTLIGFVSIGVWRSPLFPYESNFINSLVTLAEGEITQAILGIVFGLLAGFTLVNASDLIFPRPDNTGAGATASRARHVWLGGSLMGLIFLGMFAPHVTNLITNLTRFKTSLFEFEVRSGAATQRLNFKEIRSGAFGVTALDWAVLTPSIIERDLWYLEDVALKGIDSEIDARDETRSGSLDDNSFMLAKLGQEKKQIQIKMVNLKSADRHIRKFFTPLLTCARTAISRLVDTEAVRNVLRAPLNDLRLLLTASTQFGNIDSLTTKLLDDIKLSRDEIQKYVMDENKCPRYDNNLELKSNHIIDLRKSPYAYFIVAMIGIFSENYELAKETLLLIRENFGIEFNTNIFYATLLFYEGAEVSKYARFLEEIMQRARDEGGDTKRILGKCETDAKCRDSTTRGRLVILSQRYERAKAAAQSVFAFAVTVEIAEGKKTAEAWWPQALGYVSILERKLDQELDALGPQADVSGMRDTISFSKIIRESRKAAPDKRVIMKEVEKLQDLEQSIYGSLASTPPEYRPGVEAALKSIRGHLRLGVSILDE